MKFCGMTRPGDALAAAECGADAIGMLLHGDSSRKITLDVARNIIAVLPPFVTPVGLFVNAPAATVQETAEALHLSHVQLHGNEPPALVRSLRGLKVIKAIHVTRDGLDAALAPWRDVRELTAILLETGATGQAGGSGIENDWDAIAKAQRVGTLAGLPPIIAAGGLRPDNVASVIERIHPYAVDVSSGIEETRGIKSLEKMQLFAKYVHSCER
jgi:phosphoribosylanthranilate isomerase